MGKGGDYIYSLSFPHRRSVPRFFLSSPLFTIHHFVEIIPQQLLYPGWVCHRNQFLMGSYILLMLSSCMLFFSSFFFLFIGPRNRCGTDMDQTRIIGVALAWRFRGQSKLEFIHSNRTQTGLLIFLFPPSIFFFFPLWIVEY